MKSECHRAYKLSNIKPSTLKYKNMNDFDIGDCFLYDVNIPSFRVITNTVTTINNIP